MGYVRDVGEVTDLDMMQNPDWWPQLILPLKTPEWRAGVLLENGDGNYLFIPDQNMFSPLDQERGLGMKREWLGALVEQGWVVD